MEALGPHGLAVVVDLLDAIALGTGGIHIVVTDRPQAVSAELSARCPVGWVAEPLLSPERDRLSEAAQGGPEGEGVLLVDVVVPEDEGERAALHALNDSREWLLRRGTCAVVIVAGKDARRADTAYLELQAHAPDFWSVRSRVHRVVGPDAVQRMRDELLDLLSGKFEGDRAAAQRWLDGRAFEADWVTYRLWREGPRREAWLELAEPSTEAEETSMAEVKEEVVSRWKSPRESSREWSMTPMGDVIAPERWPAPRWPSGRLETAQQSLVQALAAALDRDGRAELHVLPEDEARDALAEAVLTFGLLRESRYDVVLHFDARCGLEVAIAGCLREAGEVEGRAGLLRAIQRLQGALGSVNALLLVTDVDPTELGFLRAGTSGRAVVATVRGEPFATFGVIASPSRADDARWASTQLLAWPLGVTMQLARAETAVLDLRAALGRARYVIALIDEGWSHWGRTGAQSLGRAAYRIAAFALGGEARSDVGFAVSWHGELGPDEATARERLLSVARGWGGEPFAGETLRHNQEAVQRFRGLAEERPDIHLPDLGAALTYFAMGLHKLGRQEEALRVVQESVDIHRPMAEERPNAFVPDLAISLSLRGIMQLRAGASMAAFASFAEGLRISALLEEPRLRSFGTIFRKIAGNLRRAAAVGQTPIPEDLVPMLARLSMGED